MKEMTEEECLHEQILQMREVITSIENQTNGVPAIQPEELWGTISSQDDKPMHPRLQQMIQGHVDVDQIKQGLKRLENDMKDLNLSTKEMYDPFEHELEGGKEDTWESNHQVVEDDEEPEIPENEQRDKEQRPLSAYSVEETKE